MITDTLIDIIKRTAQPMKKPVRLAVFTTERSCAGCSDAVEIARAIRSHLGKLSLEMYDLVMDRDKAELYGIGQVPATVVESSDGEAVTYYGVVDDLFLDLLMKTIHAMAGEKIWVPDDVRRTLKLLANDVKIRVFVDRDCALCRTVAGTAVGLAIENSFIDVDIIMAGDFPELVRKMNIDALPKTIFGVNIHLDGHVSEGEFLEQIFLAEGIKPGQARKCLVCGTESMDTICLSCKNRIRAEAVDHKTRIEKGMQP